MSTTEAAPVQPAVVHTTAVAATLVMRTSNTTLRRSPTWLTQELDVYLKSVANLPFTWGSNDCCMFGANAVQAMTGTDIADDFRGRYTDQASAFALIKAVTGGTTVTDAIVYCAQKHGLIEWAKADGTPLPLMAKRGDLVAVTNDASEIIAGVVDLSGRYVACMNDNGLVRLPLSTIKRAWHVAA